MGQRRGIGISAPTALYVVAKDAERNTVRLGTQEELFSDTLFADSVNWIAGTPTFPLAVRAKTRYAHTGSPATVTQESPSCLRVVFDTPQRAVTPGQSVVFYRDEEVLGGGVIQGTAESIGGVR